MLLLGGDFPGLETTTGGLNALLANLFVSIKEYGYDGVDIDWEYPSSNADSAFFYSLMQGLGGTFIWSLDEDYDGTTQDLLNAAHNASQIQTP